MACGAAGNAIQFVEKFDGVSFRHAFEMLTDGTAAFDRTQPTRRTKQATVPKLAVSARPGRRRREPSRPGRRLLPRALAAKRTPRSSTSLAGPRRRGLSSASGSASPTGRSGCGFPRRTARTARRSATRLQKLGVFRETGHEHFNGSLVVPDLRRQRARRRDVRPQDHQEPAQRHATITCTCPARMPGSGTPTRSRIAN